MTGLMRKQFCAFLFLALSTLSASAALVPSQFAGRPLQVLCNRSMQTFVPLLALQFQRQRPDVDFKLDMAVRFPYDRSAVGDDVAEVYDDMSGAKFTRKYGYEPVTILVSAGGRHQPARLQTIGVFVHPSNPIASLSMDQLEQIYGQQPRNGKPHITHWGQLGLTGEWARRPVDVYGINRFGGAPGGLFNYRVLGDGKVCDDCRELVHSPPMIKAVSENPNAIGYIAMTYVTSSVKLLPLIPRDSTVPVMPTEENVQALRYPLGTPLYFTINRVPGQPVEPYLREFLELALSPVGQKIIADEGFLPLTADAIQRELLKLK